MILTLTASIMYWSLQQQTEDADSFPSPAGTATTTTPDASPAPSICGEDENSSLGGEFSNISVDDATSDTTTVSSQLESEGVLLGDELWGVVVNVGYMTLVCIFPSFHNMRWV